MKKQLEVEIVYDDPMNGHGLEADCCGDAVLRDEKEERPTRDVGLTVGGVPFRLWMCDPHHEKLIALFK